jgi:small subunit ribosomal protein S18
MTARKKPQTRRRSAPEPPRKKRNPLTAVGIATVDYKDVTLLRTFISDRGKIRSRRITGACRRHQSQIATAVKRARELALLPYVAEATGPEREGGRRDRGDRDRDR